MAADPWDAFPDAKDPWDAFPDADEKPKPWYGDRVAPEGFTGDLTNSVRENLFKPLGRGTLRARSFLNTATGDYTEAADLNRRSEAYAPSKESQQTMDEIGQESLGGALLGYLKNPGAALQVSAESLPMSTPSLALGGLGLLAGPAGGMAGAGLGSFATEYTSSINQSAQELGIDMTDPTQLEQVMTNPVFLASAREKAVKRGVPVAAFDALSFGLAGKFAKGIGKLGLGKGATLAAGGTAEVLAQAGAGMAGEAGGQLASEGRITSPAGIAAEGVGEIVPGIVETAFGTPKAPDIGRPTDGRQEFLNRLGLGQQAPAPEIPVDAYQMGYPQLEGPPGSIKPPPPDFVVDPLGRAARPGEAIPDDRRLPPPQSTGEFVGSAGGSVRGLGQNELNDLQGQRQERRDLGLGQAERTQFNMEQSPMPGWNNPEVQGGIQATGSLDEPLSGLASEIQTLPDLPKVGQDITASKPGTPFGDVDSEMGRFTERWGPNAPKVNLVDNDNQRTPDNLKAIGEGVLGWTDRSTGEIGLVREAIVKEAKRQNISVREMTQRVALHESSAHWGAQKLMGERWDGFLTELQDLSTRDPILKRISSEVDQKYGELDAKTRNEEILGALAETNPQHGLVKRAVSYIRETLRKMGFNLKLTYDDTVALLRSASKYNQGKSFATTMKDGVLAMTVYHGSPHDFDKFDMSKIGTGEGAQAYGHGLYVAEKPGVAKSYMTADNPAVQTWHMMDGTPVKNRNLAAALKEWASPDMQGGIQAAIDNAKDFLKRPYLEYPEHAGTKEQTVQALKYLEKYKDQVKPNKGRFYEIDLPDSHIAKMLDWDAPLSHQPESVRKALSKLNPFSQYSVGKNPDYSYSLYSKDGYWDTEAPSFKTEAEARAFIADPTGSAIYEGLSGGRHGPEQAAVSAKLRKLGIPGIKYLDGGSRAAGDGTRNYVVFDDKLLKITHKDGKPLSAEEKKDILAARVEKYRADQAAKQDSRLDEKGRAREKTSGRYIGAPEWIGNEPKNLTKLHKTLRKLANEGKVGREWYEKSSRWILNMTGGDKALAEKFVGLVAIYSQSTGVASNMTAAIKAWQQWREGKPIDAGRFPVEQGRKAEAWLNRGEDWGGIKTNNFYADLMTEIDPSKVDFEHSTMDMWMALAFDYGRKTLAGSQYTFAQKEISRLAKELGWPPHQTQAAIWTAIKARVEGSQKERDAWEDANGISGRDEKGLRFIKDDKAYEHFRAAHRFGMESKITQAEIDESNYDYGSALEERSVFVPFEVRSDQLAPEVSSWSQELQDAFYRDAIALVHDEKGQNRVLAEVGINPLQAEVQGRGIWAGVISPNTMTIMALPGGANVDPTPGRLAGAYFGYGYGQDASLAYVPTHNTPVGKSHPGIQVTVEEGEVSAEDMRNVLPEIPLSQFRLPSGQTVFHFLNMTKGLSPKDRTSWNDTIAKGILSLGNEVTVRMKTFRAKGSLDEGGKNGEDYLRRLREAGRPDLQDGARRLRADFQALIESYREKAQGQEATPQTEGQVRPEVLAARPILADRPAPSVKTAQEIPPGKTELGGGNYSNNPYRGADPETQQILLETMDVLEEKTANQRGNSGQPFTWDMEDELTQQFLNSKQGQALKGLVDRSPRAAANASKIQAYVQMTMRQAQKVRALSIQFDDTNSNEDRVALLEAKDLLGTLQAATYGYFTEAGRSLGIIRRYQQQMAEAKVILEAIAGSEDAAATDFAGKIKNAKSIGDVLDITHAAYLPTRIDQVREYWINMGLLSGYWTQAVNVIGNTVFMGAFSLSELATSTISKDVSTRAALKRLSGMYAGMSTGIENAKKAFLTEEPQFNSQMQMDSPKYRAIPGKLGKVIRIPGRLLMAGDEFFKSTNYSGALHQAAMAESEKTGVPFDQVLQSYATNKEVQDRAIAHATRMTFQTPLGETGRELMRAREKVPVLGWLLFPFVRTPTNIVKEWAKFTPIGFVMPSVMKEIAASGERGAVARGQMVFGSMVMAAVAYGVLNGFITGAGPEDPKKRALWLRTGRLPYAFKNPFTGEWQRYNRFEPMSMLMGISADATEISMVASSNDKTVYDKLETVGKMIMGSFMTNIGDKTFLKGVNDFMQTMNEPGRYFESWFSGLIATSLPNVGAQAARNIDPYAREARGIVDSLKARIPGEKGYGSLPRRLDVAGEPIEGSGFEPSASSAPRNDPLAEALLRLDSSKGAPQRSISLGGKTYELTGQEYEDYKGFVQQARWRILTPIVSSPQFKQLAKTNPMIARDKLESLYDKIGSQARDVWLLRNREVVRKIASQRQVIEGSQYLQ